jgi:molybdopterin biosynthesis enzyme
LPPLPEPNLAQAIEVTGIVQLGNGDFRIVLKAPQEQSPRYVRIGDRVSGGQVLVKRVETLGDTQVVVLEEVGIEVRRAVGEASANASETPSASSVLSSSQQPGNKI